VLFKICGLKEINTVDCCERNNVNFFGMIFYKKSPRNVDIDNALNLINFSKDKKIIPVGVFVNEDLENIKSLIAKLDLKTIQLHGNENDDYINSLKINTNLKVIKTVSVQNISDFKKLNNFNKNDYFLLDYKPEINELPGGNSKQFDWSILKNLKISKPWFLSGGINISNIKKIKNFANPDGIDLSSGVEETPGEKNIQMIESLLKKYHEK